MANAEPEDSLKEIDARYRHYLAGHFASQARIETIPLSVGDKKTINIQPEEAYGERSEEAMLEFPLSSVPPDLKLVEGMQLQLRNEHGQPFPVTVSEVREDIVVLDSNHSLAGKELVFDIELVEIVSA